MKKLLFALPLLLWGACRSLQPTTALPPSQLAVIAYFHGKAGEVSAYRVDQLTHIIYSFCHLRGDELAVDDAADSLTIRELVALKQTHPQLKVLLSLGGWGGCASCSPVFARAEGRRAFAVSVRRLMQEYGADGIDLDWEYPGIEGYPGHAFEAADKRHFTELVQELRRELGPQAVISFAAGGFQQFFDHSVEWETVMPMLNFVNIMSYDLVGGFSTRTGHHTPLYSTP
ncbi:MAG: glycoside hydrolase, partial [Saprospiraceae bacterium]|nr:glycoside hydrolase [Saprospiraceae bacterium]